VLLSLDNRISVCNHLLSSVAREPNTRDLTGKTCFLFYLLLQRLCQGLPTAFQIHATRFFLFTDKGSSVHSSDSWLAFPSGTWALADSSESIMQPCNAFLEASMRDVWVIQTSPPSQSRWKDWKKQRRARLFVMDCPSTDEMEALG
jgi:hypothetical protein